MEILIHTHNSKIVQWFGRHPLLKWVVCGAFSALAWEPFCMWWVLIFTWGTLVAGIYHSKSWKEAARIGWLWSFGWHTLSVFWIGQSLWVEPLRFVWFWPICIMGIPAVFACYIGFASGVLWWGKQYIWRSAGAFGIMWCVFYSIAEYLKSTLCTGFPWNISAHVWGEQLWIAQSASLLSGYGLGLVTLLLLSWPMRTYLVNPIRSSWWRGVLYAGFGLVILATYSVVRLSLFPTQYASNVVCRLVQPNFSQHEKHDKGKVWKNWNILVNLSSEKGKKLVTHVIWPETSMPFSIPVEHIDQISPIIHGGNPIHLISGALLLTETQSFNSIIYVGSNGGQALYHKQHLVPFGEYMPFYEFLSQFIPARFLRQISPVSRKMLEGDGNCVCEIPGAPPCITQICYEIIFPIQYPRAKADWVLNLTNDGWFGYTPGPFQHLVSAQFRAIEEGLPVLRAANTGISAVFDGMGRLLAHIPLEQRGYLDSQLPIAVTSYRSLHGWIYFGMLIICVAFGGIPCKKKFCVYKSKAK